MKLSFLLQGCKPFVVNDCLKSETHRYQQTLGFFPRDALQDLHCCCLHILIVLVVFFLSVLSSASNVHSQLFSGQVIHAPIVEHSTSFPALAVCFRLLSISIVKCQPMSFEALTECDNLAPFNSDFIQLFPQLSHYQ